MASKLITAVATQVLTLEETKARLKVTDTAEDSVISGLISEIRAACQAKTRHAVGAQTWQLAFDQWPEDGIPLILPPLIAVDWVKYYDEDGALQTLAADQYSIDDFSEPGWILPAQDVTWPSLAPVANAVRVQLQCGYTAATVPPSLKLWMFANIGHFHANREVYTGDAADRPTIVDGLLDGQRAWAA